MKLTLLVPFTLSLSLSLSGRCGDATKVKLIQGGNPEVMIPDAFNKSALSWIDLSALDTNTEVININTER